MSQYRIQRKFIGQSLIKLRHNSTVPHRIKSLQHKPSYQRSPKKVDHQSLKKLMKKIQFKNKTETVTSQNRMEEGMKAYRQKNVHEALQIFKQLQKSGQRSAELSFYIGKNQSSIMNLNQCLAQNQKYNPNAYLYIAVNFKLIGNHKQAIKILEDGTKLFPQFEQAHFYKAKLYMKMGENNDAISAFKRCLQLNSTNELATIFMADCLKNTGKEDLALQKYKYIAKRGRKHKQLAFLRAAGLLASRKSFPQLLTYLNQNEDKTIENPQINYYLGLCNCELGQKKQGVVYLQSALNGSKQASVATKALKELIKVCVQQSNFFEAQYHINRISNFGLHVSAFKEWKFLVQGVNDLIKRKNGPALQKLQQALLSFNNKDEKKSSQSLQNESFKKNLYPYAAYAFYVNSFYQKSITLYNKSLLLCNKSSIKFAKHICQGLFLYKLKQFETSVKCFQQAFAIQPRIEPLFMLCITLVNKFKHCSEGKYTKQQIMQQIQGYIKCSHGISHKNPLFLFYISLILLFMGRPCINVIKNAITLCQQPMSEYYFIQALALQSQGNLKQALQSITRAIELDCGISQFYRERSKYYFLLDQYCLAIEDCKTAQLMSPDDEQLPLLLSFFYYLNDQFVASFNYIQNVKPLTGKLKQFEQALQLRLGLYHQLQQIGQLISQYKNQFQIKKSTISVIQNHITNRYQFSQFSVYFYHLLLSYGYAKLKQYQKSLNHLFGCLQEIQILIDQRQSKTGVYEVTWQQTQQMLDEIKFNIVIICLIKNSKTQAQHFINSFITETQSKELKQSFTILLDLINNKDDQKQECRLIADNQFERLSDNFPHFTIALNQHKTLITQFLISYPVKLKFTIAPQFDPSYLFNFDIDKIDHKIPPPWLKNPMNNINFTNSIRNQSVRLSQSRVSQVVVEQKQSKEQFWGIRQKLKLNKSMQLKLQKIINKQKKDKVE